MTEKRVTNVYWHDDWYWGKLFVLYSNGTYDTYKFDNFMMELGTYNKNLIKLYGTKDKKEYQQKSISTQDQCME